MHRSIAEDESDWLYGRDDLSHYDGKRLGRWSWEVIDHAKPGTISLPTLSITPITAWVKTGAPWRSERLTEYNQLLRGEAELGSIAFSTGGDW